MAKRRKAPAPPAVVEEPEQNLVDDQAEDQEEADLEEEELPWDLELQEFRQAEARDGDRTLVYLYRLLPGRPKVQVWKWVDQIPDDHEIGCRFGGGDYMVYLTISARNKTMRRRFRLDESYTAAAKAAAVGPAPVALGGAGFPVYGGAGPDPFQAFERMLGLVLPLLQAQQSNPMAGLAGMHQFAQKLIADTTRQSMELSRALVEAKSLETMEGDAGGGLLEGLLPLLPGLIEKLGLGDVVGNLIQGAANARKPGPAARPGAIAGK